MRTASLVLLLCLGLTAPTMAGDTAAVTPEYVVYYFHGKFRCEACLKIEAWGKEAVSEGFAREVKAGNLDWRVVDVQAEPNEHFADEFKLSSQALIVTEWTDGKVARWKNLEAIWDHLENKNGFADYVEAEVAAFLRHEP